MSPSEAASPPGRPPGGREPSTHPPARIGPYLLVGEIGRGAMGVVYRGLDPATGTHVAVKTCVGLDLGHLASLRREIQALERIDHPGVVRVLAEGADGGVPWLAMELLPSRTARTVLDDLRGPRSPATLERLLLLVADVCAPLAHLHEHGIVHGDLKPENVHLRDDGSPVLTDFGLVVRTLATTSREPLEVGGALFGTAAYMAPEQINGERVDARADLYALGCMLYEALTGRPPFLGASAADVWMQHLNVEPEPPSRRASGLPRWLDDLTLHLLRKRRLERLGYAESVARRIRLQLGVPLGRPADRPRPYLYRPGLVGRDDSLAALRTHIDEARDGHGALVLVTGESGVGKTRLVAEAGALAVERGVTVVLGECVASGSGTSSGLGRPTLHPFRPLLAAVADRCRAADRATTAHLVGPRGPVLAVYEPALATLPGQDEEPSPPIVSPEAALERVERALVETLVALADTGPVLLVLDDLQWADELSLRVVAALQGRALAEVPVLVIATCRSEEMDAALRAMVERAGRGVIRLEPLRVDGITRMVGDMLALPDPPAPLVAVLRAHTDGNPFFVSEYVLAAVEQEHIRRDDLGAWRLLPRASGGYDLPVPQSLRALVQLRLAALPPEPGSLVRAGSVLGQAFDESLLLRAASLDATRALAAIDDLLRRRTFVHDEQGRLAFAHGTIRTVAYEAMPVPERARLHEEAARAVEAEYPAGPARRREEATLAFHWSQAAAVPAPAPHVVAAAIDALERAADQAAESHAHHEAVRMWEEAMALARRADPPGVPLARRALWEHLLGESYFRIGRMVEARAHLIAALTLDGRPVPAGAGARALQIAREGWRQLRRRRGHAPAVARVTDPITARIARTYDLLGFVQLLLMERTPSLLSSLQALNVAETMGPSPALANSSAVIGTVAGVVLGSRVARPYFALARATAQQLANDYCLGRVAHLQGFHQIGQGEWADAGRALDEAVRCFARIGDGRWRDLAVLTTGNLHLMRSRSGALPFYREGLRTSDERGDLQTRAWAELGCAAARLAEGATVESLALLDTDPPLAERFRTMGDVTSEVDAYGLRAAALERVGRLDEARAVVETALSVLAATPLFRYDPLPGYVLPADVALRLWERARRAGPGEQTTHAALARLALGHLRSFARFIRIAQPEAWILRGLFERLNGHPRRARAFWHRALALAEGLGMPFDEARAHYELGRHAGPHADGRRDLERAVALFTELHARHELAEAERALEAADASQPPARRRGSGA